MNIERLDLNLLVALRALGEERSVSAAARRLGRSQPALSNALARLRRELGDELLVRGVRGMVLTPRAEALLPVVTSALEALERAAYAQAPFEPATSTAAFTLAATDYAELVLLPPLVRELGRRAPNLKLTIRPIDEGELPARLERGDFDGALGYFHQIGEGTLRQTLFRERFVCVVRRGHPRIRARLTLAQFAREEHLLVSPRGVGLSPYDDKLAQHGVTRRIAVRVPHFLIAPLVVAESDLLVTLAERVARAFAARWPLRLLKPPLEPAGFEVHHIWHERTAGSAPHRWLRGLLAEVARGV
jgi:DNA-binding transcriptional LysR family regulator